MCLTFRWNFLTIEGFEPCSAARSQATYMFNGFNPGSLINGLLVMAVDDAHQRPKVSVFRLHGCAVTPSLGGTSSCHSERCPRGTRFIWQFYQFLASSTS